MSNKEKNNQTLILDLFCKELQKRNEDKKNARYDNLTITKNKRVMLNGRFLRVA